MEKIYLNDELLLNKSVRWKNILGEKKTLPKRKKEQTNVNFFLVLCVYTHSDTHSDPLSLPFALSILRILILYKKKNHKNEETLA